MTAHQIEALKALALAATPGPWQWWTSNSSLRLTGADGRDGGVLHGTAHRGYGDVTCSEANRAFIEASNPAAILELIAENQRLKLERDTLDRDCALGAKRINEAADEIARLRAAIPAKARPGRIGSPKAMDRKASRDHRCALCQGVIQRGHMYTMDRVPGWERTTQFSMHLGCKAAAIAAHTKEPS